MIVGQSLLPRLESVLPDCPTVCRVVIIPGLSVVPTPANERYFDLEEVVRMGSQSKQSRSPPTPEDAAIIMFTSGSTGVPKGVVLSHANIIQALINGLPLSTALVGRVTGAAIGFLPLAHVSMNINTEVYRLCIKKRLDTQIKCKNEKTWKNCKDFKKSSVID